MSNCIPPMTDPMNRYWQQPSLDSILIDDTHAIMSRQAFDTLMEYSSSTPSGVYPGKIWKRNFDGSEWLLAWYGDAGPDKCSINSRRILIV